uniref:Ubiquitin-like protease family profile domain-containing protein n=1 Tax=Panagrolaimus sp. PS1159 TaxID=55785 RepID=A0AC35F815_9BILA
MLNAERAEEEIRLFLLRVQRMHQDSLYNFILPSINSPKFGVYLSVGVKAPGLHDGMLVNYIHEQTTDIFFPNCSGHHFRMYRYNIATNELYFIDPIDNQNPPYTPYLRNIQTYLSQKFNVTQPVVHPHDPFVPAFVQQEGDSVNCGYFILALIEYFSKGFNPTQQHYNFNIYQYKQRCIQLFDYIINNRVVTLDALKQ